jgi:hypothetical protein
MVLHIRHLVALVLVAVVPGTSSPYGAPPSPAPNCGPEIANLGAIAGVPIVLLGELHGLQAVPAFAITLACRLAAAGTPVMLALEIPRQEQARIDAFLASNGGKPNEQALLDGPFWRREFQDGRSSLARLALLDAARTLRAAGVPLRVVAVDDASVPAPGSRRRDGCWAPRCAEAGRDGVAARRRSPRTDKAGRSVEPPHCLGRCAATRDGAEARVAGQSIPFR